MNYIQEIQSLRQYGNVPITANMLNNLLCSYKAPKMKIQAMVRNGSIIRIKKDMYVVSPEISGKPLSPELIANHLYGPSYVSLHYALNYYGIIVVKDFNSKSAVLNGFNKRRTIKTKQQR